MSVNQELFDAANRHQTFLIRYGGSTAKKITGMIEEAEKDLASRIAARVKKLGPQPGDRTTARMQGILAALKRQNQDLTTALSKETSKDLHELARQEVEIADVRLNQSVGVELNNFRPSPEQLRTLLGQAGLRKTSLGQWYKRLGADRFNRLEAAVRLGVVEGDTLDEMVRRFAASEEVTKRSARSLVRTHVNHVGNGARQMFYEANEDIMKGVRWTATLDGRTSQVCMGRDGTVYRLEEGPRPPAHPNCRSLMTPVTKSWKELAKKGSLKKGRGSSNIDALFNKFLLAQGFKPGVASKIMRNARSSMDGAVPDKLTYDAWLRRQPKGFVVETLGPTKAELFLNGNLKLDKFVEEPTGRAFTLKEIRDKNRQAWMEAFPPKVPDLEPEIRTHLMLTLNLSGEARDDALTKLLDKISDKPNSSLSKAKKVLESTGEWDKLTAVEKTSQLLSIEKVKKLEITQSANLSSAKWKMKQGKPISPGEQATLDSLSDDAHDNFMAKVLAEKEEVDAVVTTEKIKSNGIGQAALEKLESTHPQLTGAKKAAVLENIFQAEKEAAAAISSLAEDHPEMFKHFVAGGGFKGASQVQKFNLFKDLVETTLTNTVVEVKATSAAAEKMLATQFQRLENRVKRGVKLDDEDTRLFNNLPFEDQDAFIKKNGIPATKTHLAAIGYREGELIGESLEEIGPKPGGSLPGYKAAAKDSSSADRGEWVVKFPPGSDAAQNEVLAAKLYEAAGVEVPDVRIVRFMDGRTGVASRWIDGVEKNADDLLLKDGIPGVHDNYAVDAWLANWDVVGLEFDNLVMGPTGRFIRIDVGGSLKYRAQGGLKTNFDEVVDEIDTLRDSGLNPNSFQVFGTISKADMEDGVRKVLAMTDSKIDELVELYGPTDYTPRAAMAKVLKARRDNLAKQFPKVANPPKVKAKPVPKAEVTATEVAELKASRSNGLSRRTDKGQIEDQNVLLWEERTKGGKKTWTGAQFKLSEAEARKLTDEVDVIDTSSVRGLDTSLLGEKVISALKGIKAHDVLRSTDITRVGHLREALDNWKIKAARMGNLDEEAFKEASEKFESWVKALETAVKPGEGKIHKLHGAFSDIFEPPPVVPVTEDVAKSAWVNGSGTFDTKLIENGHLVRSGDTFKPSHGFEIQSNYWELNKKGVRIRFWPVRDITAKALQGQVEIMANGAGDAAVRSILREIEDLGVTSKRASVLDREEMYLAKHFHARQEMDVWRNWKALPQKDRLERAGVYLSEKAGYNIRQSRFWNPEGLDNGFGHTAKSFERADVDKFSDNWDNYEFSHNSGMSITVFKALVEEGGHFSPKVDWFRKGRDFTKTGMSPTSDMEGGGGAYLYTTLSRKGNGGQFRWDVSLARRVDARNHVADGYGKIDDLDSAAARNTLELDNPDKWNTYETLFKDGVSLFRNGFTFKAGFKKTEVIDWLKTKGKPYSDGLWPDGRKLEEVILE